MSFRALSTPQRHGTAELARERPMCDRTAITFAIDDPFAARAAMTSALADGTAPVSGLEAVLREVGAEPNVRIQPVFAERAVGVLGPDRWRLALANQSTAHRRLSGIHLLLYEGQPSERTIEMIDAWRRALRTDRRVAYAEHPMIAYPVLDLTSREAGRPFVGTIQKPECKGEVTLDCHQQWGLRHCGFDCIWDELDVGVDPGLIGILDMGLEPKSQAEFGNRIVKYVTPPGHDPFVGTHPAAVAGIISAIRDGSSDETMLGCCSGSLEVFSIYTKEGKNCAAFYDMVKTLGAEPLRVVNMSFESECQDPTLDRMIKHYVHDERMIFVAAMGNRGGKGNPKNWPASHEDVIAVGAIQDLQNARYPDSCTGDHIFMAAPGFDILTVDPTTSSGYRCIDGTSMAAPHVTAAIWLALRQRPAWGVDEIRCLLSQSVKQPGKPWNTSVGHGCLDVRRMAMLLRGHVCG